MVCICENYRKYVLIVHVTASRNSVTACGAFPVDVLGQGLLEVTSLPSLQTQPFSNCSGF